MPHASQNSGGDLIKTAARFKRKYKCNTDTGHLYDGDVRSKKSTGTGAEQCYERSYRTAGNKGGYETYYKDLFTAFQISCRIVLAYKCSCTLPKCSDQIISEVFEIHRYRAACDSGSTETVYCSLYKNICETEDASLNCGGNAYTKDIKCAPGVDPQPPDIKVKTAFFISEYIKDITG